MKFKCLIKNLTQQKQNNMNKNKKKKILFFGWDNFEWETIQNEIQKFLGKSFELIFVTYDINALDEIAKAKLLNNQPISAIVFKRNTLVANARACKVMIKFAEHYQDTKFLVSINLIYNDQDVEARDCAVSATFANMGDWKYVATIIQNNT